jgi:hypothetical protein
MRWHEVQPETVRIQHDEKSKQRESSIESRRKCSESSESSSRLEVKRKHHETSDDGSSNDDSSDADIPLRRKHKTSKSIIRRRRIMRRKHKVRGWQKKLHRRKLKIIPQLPPSYGLRKAIQLATSNPRYRASQVDRVNPFPW